MSSPPNGTASNILGPAAGAMASSSSSSLSSSSTVPPPPPPPPPSPTASLLASSPESPEEIISTITVLSSQASSHLRASEQTDDYYDSALALMQVHHTINLLIDRLLPDHSDLVLTRGPFRGKQMLSVLAAEMFNINIRLCEAFSELGMWELVGPRVSNALELAEMSRGHFYVSVEAREWLREMGEIAEEQVGIDSAGAPASDA